MAEYFDRTRSICNKCIDTECVWRTTGWGKDPPIMAPCPSFKAKPYCKTCKERSHPKTNGDNVRSMSNKQIAGVACTGCPPGVESERCDSVLGGEGSCYNCWFNWLQSPAGGDEDGGV